MKRVSNLKNLGDIAYVSPEIQVYEIGIEDSILIVSGETPPSMGYDSGDAWS